VKKTILSLFVSLLLLSGCASILSNKYQDVTVITSNPSHKVYIDNNFVGEGDTLTWHLKKECKVKEIRVEDDSCKPYYGLIFQEDKSNWHILSWFPFGILCFLPPLLDIEPSSWNYEDYVYTPQLKKYVYWNSGSKRLFADNFSFNIPKGCFTARFYNFDEYKYGGWPRFTKELDSMKLQNTTLSDHIDKVLKKCNFIDTVNTVFIDHANTLVLNCEVNEINYFFVSKSYGISYGVDFAYTKLKSKWYVADVFGDTLFVETFDSESNKFTSKDVNDDKRDLVADAIENAYLELMNSKKMKALMVADTSTKSGLENIAIARPSKNPANTEEALKASVTVKCDDGHGSGFLVSNDGYIITNYHVINNEKNLKAIDSEGKEYPITVVRFSKTYDLALLKVEGNFEYALAIPSEKNFKTGQDAFAIGTPKSVQLGQTLSKGIISGFRTMNNMSYVQTDISINKGNSGGAIVNSAGELVGVVDYKMFGFGTEGLSFSIPGFDIMKALALSYQ